MKSKFNKLNKNKKPIQFKVNWWVAPKYNLFFERIIKVILKNQSGVFCF